MNIRTEQLGAIRRMLQLRGDKADDGTWHEPWKVLVYDRFCRDVISPLLNIGELRKQGVTLHLLLDGDREQIADVPAVYFVQPTASAVKRIADDCARRLYDSFYINFTPSVPRPLLENLASDTLASESVAQVSRVMDQHLNFASLEEDFFTLLLPGHFQRLYDTSGRVADTEVEEAANQIACGLYSVLASLRVAPVLRYAMGGPAQKVAEILGQKLYDQLRARTNPFTDGGMLQRPLLVLLDRTSDVSVMLQHAWSYCALCHDVLDVRLNHIKLPETMEGGKPQKRAYDLHASDTFWAEHKGSAFQTVASEVDRQLNDYRQRMEAIDDSRKADLGADAMATSMKVLETTMSAIPELQEKKRLVDAHTNIASELLSHIKDRSLDSFFALEEGMLGGKVLSKDERASLAQLMADGGTREDRLRLLLLLELNQQAVGDTERAKFEEELRAAGADLTSLAWLREQQAMRTAIGAIATENAPAGAMAAAGRGVFSNVMDLADKVGVGSTARSVTSGAMAAGALAAGALAAGVKQLLPSKRATAVTSAVSILMDNKGGAQDDAFGWLDPKTSPTAESAAAANANKTRAPFSHALVFLTGPGNYLEYQTLRQAAPSGLAAASAAVGGAPPARHVAYGCSEVLTPSEFLSQLAQLGAGQPGK